MIVQLNVSGEECTFSSWRHSKMYTPDTTANSQTEVVLTKINKNAAAKVYKNFSGTTDTIRHLKTFWVISNEMSVLLFILIWCYFSCLKIYSEKCLNNCFYEQMFFAIFVVKWDTGQLLLENNN